MPTACTTIEEVGSTGVGALTVAFIILVVVAVVFLAKATASGEQKRYYYCATYIAAFTALAYFAMLSGQGWTAIAGCRQFFYARFAEMLVTEPLLILMLGLIANADASTIGAAVGADVVYILCLYMGAVSVVTTVKWFWFLVSIIALGGIISSLARSFKDAAALRTAEVAELYGKVAWLTILVWICYPVVWLFSTGFASFSVSFEVCAYAILDVIMKCVISFMVMSAHDTLGQAVSTSKEIV